MKNRINTNSLRTIKKSFPRFISLIVMSLLGVLVFVGLKSTSPDMLNTLDRYYDKNNVYDIKIISSLGLIEEDITALKNIQGIKDIEGSYSEDILLKSKDKEYVLNISSLPETLNKIDIIKGRIPSTNQEIIVEENLLKDTDLKIGDKIIIESDSFHNQEVTIVGTVLSPLFFNNTDVNQTRGPSTLGTGSINYYTYVPKSNFNLDYYTSIYITIDNAKEKTTSKDNYKELVNKVTNNIDKIKKTQEDNRYNKIKQEALDEITKEENKIKKELSSSKKDLDKAKKQLNKAKKKLDISNKQLTTFKKELDKAKKSITAGRNSYYQALKKNNLKESELLPTINELKKQIKKLESLLTTLNPSSQEYETYSNQLNILKQQLTGLETLYNTKKQLDKAEKTYNDNYKLYKNSKKAYNKGLSSYKNGRKKYNKGLKKYNEGKKTAEEEITSAKAEVEDLKHPSWYIQDRSDNQTYSIYIGQTKSINNLAKVFPVVFYSVAILVSLISMNRMVEDDRGEIGTLKSLGFNNQEIIRKYIVFSLTATIIGGIVGVILGLTAIPYLIFVIYRLLFVLPKFYIGLNLSSCLTGLIIAILCISGASIITARRILKEKPATLMRPKPPKSGKKIFLENLPFIWTRLKFSKKITTRNIFRYKKRVMVTIIGICGCTALMLCGFGIKDSIVDITNMQYGKTFKYDGIVYTNELDITKVKDMFNQKEISEYIISEQITGTYKESSITMLVVKDDKEFKKIINTVDSNNKEINLTDNGVIINDKLADIYNISIGDKITVLDSEQNSYTFKISKIAKNYMGHYIYLTSNTLSKYKEYKPNTIYFNTIKKLSPKEQTNLSKRLLTNKEIINVVHSDTLRESTKDMLDSLDKIIAVIIILAAALSFVVLYNLSNINITERKREIATLKVLGFYNKEVDDYITKENMILTIIGVIIGLVFGNFLTFITIGTVEMENSRFLREVSVLSHIYASLIAIGFTLIVNFVTHFSLKKIDMIESLKSVE